LKREIKIGIAEDEQLFLKALCTLINTFEQFTVVAEALNGEELIKKLSFKESQPDIVLLDVNMPVMDGIQTARELSEKYPCIKTVALSIRDDDVSIISMLRAGCCAYLLKDMHPDELEKALLEISRKGFYNADVVNLNYRRLMMYEQQTQKNTLTNKELVFLQFACSELTYKEIASEMRLAERTIDGYRESLFEKLNVQSRVGMAMEAIRRKLVRL
jgi:DNA-binding NarL/FixJ family response regulator